MVGSPRGSSAKDIAGQVGWLMAGSQSLALVDPTADLEIIETRSRLLHLFTHKGWTSLSATGAKQNQTKCNWLELDGFGEVPQHSLAFAPPRRRRAKYTPSLRLTSSFLYSCCDLHVLYFAQFWARNHHCIHTYHVRAPLLVCVANVGSAYRQLR